MRATTAPPACGNSGALEVSIFSDGMEIVTVPQRDLFSKYDWPAEDEIIEALEKFKVEGKDYVPKGDDFW